MIIKSFHKKFILTTCLPREIKSHRRQRQLIVIRLLLCLVRLLKIMKRDKPYSPKLWTSYDKECGFQLRRRIVLDSCLIWSVQSAFSISSNDYQRVINKSFSICSMFILSLLYNQKISASIIDFQKKYRSIKFYNKDGREGVHRISTKFRASHYPDYFTLQWEIGRNQTTTTPTSHIAQF